MKSEKAFSIPEFLITLTIIGVVSAMLLPTLIRQFNERVNSYKEANVANKITQAMEHMNAAGDLNFYATTEDFVQALSKHLKIAKICSNNNLTECWSAKTVRTANGGTYEVKNAKTGQNLHTGNLTNNVGLVLADGTQLILTYNPNVGANAGDNITGSKKTLPIGFGKTKDFAYTTSVTSGIDYVVDVNGTAGPNAETSDDGQFNDIRSFRTASFSDGCLGFKVNGVCVVDLGTSYASVNCNDSGNAKYCMAPESNHQSFDYQAGAIKACQDMGLKLPNENELRALLLTNHNSLPENGDFVSSTYYNFHNRAYYFTKSGASVSAHKEGLVTNRFRALCISGS